MVDPASIVVALLNGLANGMTLFLAAVGLTLIFGVLGVLNFAHGSLYMLGAYFTVVLIKADGALSMFNGNFWLLLVVVPILVAIIGAFMEYFIIRRIYDHEHEYQLLLTFGLVLLIDNGIRIIYGADPRSFGVPSELSFSIDVLGSSWPAYNLFLIVFGTVVIVALWSLFNFTRFGRQVRAAAQDREIASAHGIDVYRIFTIVFFLGSLLAALGGVLAAPFQTISPTMGENIIIESFIIVVIGGLGSFGGALVAALLIGLINSLAFLYVPAYEPYIPFVLMAGILLLKPSGLFGREEVA